MKALCGLPEHIHAHSERVTDGAHKLTVGAVNDSEESDDSRNPEERRVGEIPKIAANSRKIFVIQRGNICDALDRVLSRSDARGHHCEARISLGNLGDSFKGQMMMYTELFRSEFLNLILVERLKLDYHATAEWLRRL